MPIVWLNGNFLDETAAHISVRDTGLLHGAGIFTTMRAYGGKVFRLAEHLRRLRKSSEALFIPLQYKDPALIEATEQLLSRNSLRDARLRITITRGMARQDPLHGLALEPTVFITAADLEPYPREYYDRGMTVVVLEDQKLNPYDIQAGHKTLDYFSRLTALRSANQRGGGEALWFNVHNYLQSGSITNVFLVKAGRIITPPTPADLLEEKLRATIPYPRSSVLPGITRQVVLELAKTGGIEAAIASININQLLEADELFLTNSIMGIMPVCRVERHAVGTEKPGELTLKLSSLYEAQVQRELM